MKYLKRVLRLCVLFLFMSLALAGIGITGAAPLPNKDNKLLADIEIKTEVSEQDSADDESTGTVRIFN